MTKKIAVLVRDRQEEALRMALGLILLDDIIDVFVLDRKITQKEKNIGNVEMINDMGMNLYTNCRENDTMPYLSNEEIAQRLLEYDTILPY
jgi:hypothetical protein